MQFVSKVLAGMFAASAIANAAVIISNVSNTPSGSNFLWTYTFAVQPDQTMRQTCTGTCALPNDFAILYDFPGYIAGSAVLANTLAGRTFSITQQNTGVNPPFQGPPDSASLPNFIVSLTGGGDIVPAGPGAVNIFDLVLLSTLGPDLASPNVLAFGGQALNKATLLTAGNSGQILGPGSAPPPPPGIPEPSSMALLGGGLCVLGGAARLKRR